MKKVFLLLFTIASICKGANILGIFTSPSPSHLIVHMAITKALIERGHNLTVLTTLPLKEKKNNFRHVLVPPSEEARLQFENRMIEMTNTTKFAAIKLMVENIRSMTQGQYDIMINDKFQDFLKEDNKFDLVIMGYFLNDYQLAVVAQLNCPVILSWLSLSFSLTNTLTGNPTEVSYVPHQMVASKQPMTFLQRVANFLFNAFGSAIEMYGNIKMEEYYNEYFEHIKYNQKVPSFSEMQRNISLILCNGHSSEGLIRPNVPGIVEIGGIQIKEKPDPLDDELKNFLDSSKNGAILFSMGSNVKVSKLGEQTIRTFYNVFSKLKQNVVWKWEDPTNFPGNAPNILFRKWLPQDDVLPHKNIKLFVTHGGKGSVVESQYHGVPMVGLPVFGDQPSNIDKMVKDGFGLKMDYNTMTEEEFKSAIMEILENPSYSNKVQTFSKIYKDRPLTAKQTAVYWVEYVMRHHGAPHMQSPAVHMNFFTRNSLDVVSFCLVIIYIIVKLIKASFCMLCKLMRKNKTKRD